MSGLSSLEIIIYAVGGGILPALLWLLFWLREDRKHPEPSQRLLLSFLMGMLVVPLVIPFETAVQKIFASQVALFIVWALIEEVGKFSSAYLSALRTKDADEPLDPIIYLITTALGFAALENTLFLIGPLTQSGIIDSLITGNLRFVGATLLHVLSSATIGIFIAFAFYKGRSYRAVQVLVGLFFAIALHASFNLLIISYEGTGTLITFGLVWCALIVFILLVERIKKIKQSKLV